MHSDSPYTYLRTASKFYLPLLATSVALVATSIGGCGGGSGTGAALSGNTAVTVLASSTANDQLSRFKMTVTSLTLTSQSGKTITVFSTPQGAEFIHLNGSVEPLTTVSIPQDVYSSATASVAPGGPTCVDLQPAGGLHFNSAIGFGPALASDVTINLPAPITVTGTSMGIVLNLQASQSVSSFDCVSSSLNSASITPTFSLTPVVIAALPTDSTNGKATGLHGFISTVDTGGIGFNVTAADGPSWQVKSAGGTAFQGVTGSAQLTAGMPVDMDVAIQADGSLLATRVAVYDMNPANLTVSSGPPAVVWTSQPTLTAFLVEGQGLLELNGGGTPIYDFDNATFQISGQLTNVQSLPFAASFNLTNMVAGQNVLTSTHALSVQGHIPTTTMTLLPQTINGTVSAVSSSGSFTSYTVTLAAYDLFSNLAVQGGQTTLLTNPSSVIVYVDSNTHLLNRNTLAVGSLLRFNGLVFNDNGTLRMDCAQVNDGVTM